MASESLIRNVLASAARTVTTGVDFQTNCRQLVVVLDITTPGTGSITLSIRQKGLTSAAYRNVLTGNAETTTVTRWYRVSPHITAAANADAQDIITQIMNVNVVANNANTITYSVDIIECV